MNLKEKKGKRKINDFNPQTGHQGVEGAEPWRIDKKFLPAAPFISQKIKTSVPWGELGASTVQRKGGGNCNEL